MPDLPVAVSSSRVAFCDGALAGELEDLVDIRFCGSRCAECGTALLVRRRRCENCASRRVEDATFAVTGRVHTFTVQRYPPPLPFEAGAQWRPRVIAWIDLDGGGPRILGPIVDPPEAVSIGQCVAARFLVGWRDADGREVVAFEFRGIPSTERIP